MKISLHIHSEHSKDSKLSISTIISRCSALGYDAIAITDHNTVAGSVEACKLQPENISIITGAEFSTDKGHILAFFIDEQIEKNCKKIGNVYDFEDLIKKVRQQEGLLFLAHPLQSEALADSSFIEELDGYELINARIHSSHKKVKENNINKILKEKFPNKIVIGGSDAHNIFELKSLYFTSKDNLDLKNALFQIQNIYFAKSSMANTRFNNIINNKNMSLKYYIKQSLLVLFGLLYDFYSMIRGNNYETIQLCKKNK